MNQPQPAAPQNSLTEDEYFAFSRTAPERWEFHPLKYVTAGGSPLGAMKAMSGETDDHSAISTNIGRVLGNALIPQGCRVYVADMRVHTGDGLNTFPDVTVVCGPREYHQSRTDTLLNPLLIVEVLSPSTESYDRGHKFQHYQTIPSLQDYLLVEQDEPLVVLCSRLESKRWELQFVAGQDSQVTLPSVGVTIALADIYALIEFPAQESFPEQKPFPEEE